MAHSLHMTSSAQGSQDTPTVRNNRPDSLSIPLGQPSISFRPPVHRKHDNHPPKGKSKVPPRTAYTDVPLRLFGSQSDPEDIMAQCSPTKSSSLSSQRPVSNTSGQNRTSTIEEVDEGVLEADYNEEVFLDNSEANVHNIGNSGGNNKVTMTGTIKRGKKQDVVRVSLSQHEVNALNRASKLEKDKQKRSKCGCRMGPHIVLLSLLYLPIAFLTSFIVSFYIGTMCWYNVYIYLSEEKSIVHKIFLCPLLIIFYPILIIVLTLVIALYAAVVQLSWYFSSWFKEIKDFDKNFYGCLCEKLHIPQCSPYEVVVIDDTDDSAVASQHADCLLLEAKEEAEQAVGEDEEQVDEVQHRRNGEESNMRARLLQQIRNNGSGNNTKEEHHDEVRVEIVNHLDHEEVGSLSEDTGDHCVNGVDADPIPDHASEGDVDYLQVDMNEVHDQNVNINGKGDSSDDFHFHGLESVSPDCGNAAASYVEIDHAIVNGMQGEGCGDSNTDQSPQEYNKQNKQRHGNVRLVGNYDNWSIPNSAEAEGNCKKMQSPQECDQDKGSRRQARNSYDNWCIANSSDERVENDELSTKM